jgi:hypothetical protein
MTGRSGIAVKVLQVASAYIARGTAKVIEEMERNLEGSFLDRHAWNSLVQGK